MIHQVEMINWKAYDEMRIELGPGINFIMGPNGIGKTSLLEAISFALIGEPLTVRHARDLIRNPSYSARVTLHFDQRGDEYVLRREVNRERLAEAALRRGHTVLARGHARITARMEELFGTRAEFFKRIVYMAEGDVFRFVNKPPGQAVTDQIDEILGLTQLAEFEKALGLARRQLRDKEAHYRDLIEEYDRVAAEEAAEGEAVLLQTLEVLQTEVRRHQSEMAELRVEESEAARELRELEEAEQVLRDGLTQAKRLGIAGAEEFPRLPLSEWAERVEAHVAQLKEMLNEIRYEEGRLRGQAEAHQKTLDLLRPFEGREETVPCPVCHKPMTVGERTAILAEIKVEHEQVKSAMAEQRRRLAEQEQMLHQAESVAALLRRVRDRLAHGAGDPLRRPESWSGPGSVEGSPALSLVEIGPARQRLAEKQRARAERVRTLQRDVDELQRKMSRIMALRQRIEASGLGSVEEAQQALVRTTRGQILVEAAKEAARSTRGKQRNENLRAVYREIAHVWERFMRHRGWEVQLRADGAAELRDVELGRSFDLSQLSGGEKTAFLVIIHTIIARYFSRTDFLMIDEPLEHLDAVNRRSLLRFLVEAYESGVFQQMIITTFEESLVRKYLSEPGVNVIYLEAPVLVS